MRQQPEVAKASLVLDAVGAAVATGAALASSRPAIQGRVIMLQSPQRMQLLGGLQPMWQARWPPMRSCNCPGHPYPGRASENAWGFATS